MENDQRLTPLPVTSDLHVATAVDYSLGYSPSYDGVNDNKRSIREYFNIVYKRLPIILAITVLVTAAAAFYSYRLPSQYRAQTKIIIEPKKPQVTQKDAININFGDDEKYYKTQLELLQNQALMERVVVSLGLHRDPTLFGDQGRGIIAGLRSLFGTTQKAPVADNALPVINDASIDPNMPAEIQLTPEESGRVKSYAAMLVGGLSIEQVERTNIVNIVLQTTEPLIAPKVTDRVAQLFIDEDIRRETYGATKAYEELKASIEELKGTLMRQEDQLIREMANGDLPLGEKGGDLRATNLQALLKEWRDAQTESGRLQAMYSAAVAASANGDVMAVVGNNEAIRDARSQNIKRQADLEKRIEMIDTKINEASEKRQTLLVKYTPAYREVVSIDAQIKELQEQRAKIEKEVATKIKTEGDQLVKSAEREVLASLRSQLAASQQREGRQRAAFEQAASKANVEGVAETRLTSLNREIATNRNLMDAYVQRQKEQELALSTNRPENIKLHSNAQTANLVGPNRGRNILVALLLSLGAGIGLAFLMDYLDDSVRTSDDISRHLQLPTLALIPHHLSGGDKKRLLAARNGDPPGPGSGLISVEEKNSPMAEAYRHLRTSLLFSSAGKPPQTILVTSSQPSEGKTTTAINTAITLAQSDVEVVIIDCDLRRPRLHNHFQMENNRGLTNYLSGDKETEGLIRTYKDLPRLKIITSGPIPPNPAELLSSNEMRNLLQFLTGKFKHVIIDSPPAISFTDATILSTLVDGVVLVAMANKSSLHLMRQFKQRVATIGARIYGVVLNGVKANSTEYYYYGSGYYNYYANPDDDDSTPLLEDVQQKRGRDDS